MIKCSETECTLYSKDGGKKLGTYPFSEHEGEEGARKAAGKQEQRAVMFREMKKSLADVVDEFGAPATLEYIIKALGGDCEGIILKSAFEDILGFDIEKARKKRVRRVTIEDEDDDDDGDEEERTTTTKKKATPPKPETEDEIPAEEGGGEEPAPRPVEEEGGGGEPAPKPAEEEGGEAGLPKGWTPESLTKYWESLGGGVESCVAKAPDTVKDKQRFCTRLQAKVGAAGGGKGEAEGEKPTPPQPTEKSIEEALDILIGMAVEKAFKRAGAPGGVGYKGAVGWDDPRSWLGEGKDAEDIRKRAWEGMGGSVTDCIAKVKGKVDDPGAFCASLKDEVTGTTMWRGKKGKEEEAVIGKSVNDLSVLDDLLYGEGSGIDWDDWEGIEKSLPEWEITIAKEESKDSGTLEDAEDAEDEDEDEEGKDKPTFLDVVRNSHQRKMGNVVGGLVEEMKGELEVK